MAYDWTQDANCEGAWLYTEGSGTTVADASGNGNTGTFLADGEPAWVGSVTGTNAPAYATDCIQCDGSNDYVSYGTAMDNLGPLSYTVWFFPDAVTSGKNLYSASATIGGAGSSGMTVNFYGTADIQCLILNTGSGAYWRIRGLDAISTTDRWVHFATTWDGTTNTEAASGAMYVNGVEASVTRATEGGTRRSDATYYKQIPTSFDGKITENALFSIQLDSTDINDIYSNGLKQQVTSRFMKTNTKFW